MFKISNLFSILNTGGLRITASNSLQVFFLFMACYKEHILLDEIN